MGRAIVVVFVFYATLGLIATGMATAFPGLPPYTAVDDLVGHLQIGLVFPTFLNPFAETIITYTSFPNAPTELAFNGTDPPDVTFVGCENTTNDRVACFNGTNRSAYMEVTSNGVGRMRMSFNFTNPAFIGVDPDHIRMIRFTVSCFAPTGNFAFPIAALAEIGDVPAFGAGYVTGCPVDDEPGRFSQEFHNEGLALKTNATGSYPATDLRVHFYLPFGLSDELPPEGTKVRIDFFKIEIAVAEVDSGCAAPEGAWLPWADEIACAIGRFADFVWKGIQFVINGISFILVSIGSVLVFIGALVVKALAVPIAGMIWLADIFGAVDPTLAAVVTAVAALLLLAAVFDVLSLVRGTPGGI